MEQIILLLMLTGVTHAFFSAGDTKCNVTGHNSSLCSPTLGGSVYIQVMNNASGHVILCKKKLPSESVNVFTLKRGQVTKHGQYKNRTEFFINNGTLQITNLERNDSGQYRVEIYNSDGRLLRHVEVKLDVKENIFLILIPVCCAVGALLIVVIICCVCRRARRNKKKKNKSRKQVQK